eukprot:3688932-Rhodomonas_salina.4
MLALPGIGCGHHTARASLVSRHTAPWNSELNAACTRFGVRAQGLKDSFTREEEDVMVEEVEYYLTFGKWYPGQ